MAKQKFVHPKDNFLLVGLHRLYGVNVEVINHSTLCHGFTDHGFTALVNGIIITFVGKN